MVIKNTGVSKAILAESVIFEVYQDLRDSVITVVKPSRAITDSEYNDLKLLLGTVGGFWQEKYKGFTFWDCRGNVQIKLRHCIDLDEYEIADKLIHRSKNKFYPTPAGIAKELVNLADITNSDICLEPSAGRGGILKYIVQKTRHYVAVELDKENADYMIGHGYKVYNMAFEEYYNSIKVKQKEFTRVVMNPPFAGTLCLQHVMMAYDLLVSGGKLVTILPENSLYYSNNEVTERFNRLLRNVRNTCKPMDARVFRNMGINVDTVLLIMYK